jgi:hypothetical protein
VKTSNLTKLTLNLDKINIITFITYNSPKFLISIGYEDKYIEESVHTTFLGLQNDKSFKLENPRRSDGPKVKHGMLCSKIPVTNQQHHLPEINLFCLLSLLNERRNNFMGKFI